MRRWPRRARGSGSAVRLIVLTLLAAVAASSCTGEASGGARVTIDTVAGVVRVRNAGAGDWRERDAWRIGEPTVRIGALDGDDAYVFGEIAGIVRAADGRIFVADAQAREIRAFDGAGRYLFRFGRSGEGPGEFAALDGLLLTPDGQLLARDPRRFRVTRFDSAGDYVSDFRLQRPYIQFGLPEWFWVDGAGTIYDRVSLTLGMQSTDSLGVIIYGANGTVRDTVLVAEQPRNTVLVTENGVPRAGLQIPFTARPALAVAPDGRIARTLGERFDFELFDASGAKIRTIERAVEPVAVTAAARDSAAAALRERAQEIAPGAQLQDFTMPSTRPAVSHVLADAEGNWWLGARTTEAFPGQPAEYHVFDADGTYLGAVATSFRIVSIGHDWVAGIVQDELDASYAVIAPLMKPRD